MKIPRLATAGVAAAACLVAGVTGVADAQPPSQPGVVSTDPSNFTPHLADDNTGVRPRVLALGKIGNTLYAGGMFHLSLIHI